MSNPCYNFKLLPYFLEKLMRKLNIAVVYSGDSKEEGTVIYRTQNIRPWKSYKGVAGEIQTALQEIGFSNVFLFPEEMNLAQKLKECNIHLVWLNTGGVQGYNPMCHTAALLEMLGMSYIGHNPLNYSILDNKHVFKQMIHGMGLKTSPFVTWDLTRGLFKPERDIHFQAVFGDYQGPFIAKPVSGRASHNVFAVPAINDLQAVVLDIYESTQNTVLIEKYLPGREYCVAVSGNVISTGGTLVKLPEPFVFSEIERVLDEDEMIFTSMDKRSICNDRVLLLSEGSQHEIRKYLGLIGRLVFSKLGLNTLIRLDIRADSNGILNILEANPKPDLKKPANEVTSLVCKGLKDHRMSYNDLILSIFANQLDYLFENRHTSIAHILRLL